MIGSKDREPLERRARARFLQDVEKPHCRAHSQTDTTAPHAWPSRRCSRDKNVSHRPGITADKTTNPDTNTHDERRMVCGVLRLRKLRRRARRNRIAAWSILLGSVMSFMLPFYVIYRPPALLIRYLASRHPDVLWEVQTEKKIIGLTIDDAPSEHTSDIASILAENDAHATFFVIGSQIEGRTAVLEDLVTGGHELGNHAMHDEAALSLSDKQLRFEIGRVRGKLKGIYESAGVEMPANYFRPGSGFFNKRMRRLVDFLGYRLVLGSVYPHDPQIDYPKLNAWHILSMARPGAIIICHDRRSWTAPMLRTVLPELRRRGYEVVTITKLLEETEG